MVDPESPTWQHLRAAIEKRIEDDRTALEMPNSSIEGAQLIRGRLQAFREVLAFAKPAPTIRSEVGTIL